MYEGNHEVESPACDARASTVVLSHDEPLEDDGIYDNDGRGTGDGARWRIWCLPRVETHESGYLVFHVVVGA